MADIAVSMCDPSAWTPGTTGGGERGASYRQFVDNRGNNEGRIHTEEPFDLRGADSLALEIESGFMVSMWFFDADQLSIGVSLGKWATGGTYAVPDGAVYAAVLYARQSGAIAPSDVADHPFYVTLSGGGVAQ